MRAQRPPLTAKAGAGPATGHRRAPGLSMPAGTHLAVLRVVRDTLIISFAVRKRRPT